MVKWGVKIYCNGKNPKSQNKLLRFLNKTSLKDKISTKSMLVKHNMLSINQLNAQIKLTEIWKAVEDVDHPFKIQVPMINTEAWQQDTSNRKLWLILQKTFINDSIKAWNLAPNDLKIKVNIYGAKVAIKTFWK